MSNGDPVELPGTDIFEAGDIVFSVIARPLLSSSLFYALYYLVEVEGLSQAAFDFKQERERQYQAFYYYGNFSLVSEFQNATQRYYIVGREVREKSLEELDEHAHEFLFPENEAFGDAAFELLERTSELNNTIVQRNQESVVDALLLVRSILEKHDVGVSWAEYAVELFDAMPSRDKGPDTMRRDDDTGWPHGYDGPSWSGIAEHIARHDELSETAWVDQSWSIEHNNNRWIDKIDFDPDIQEAEAVRDLVFGPEFTPEDAHQNDIRGAVGEILDAAREGDMTTVFDWAQEFTDQVDVNLRRARMNAMV